MQTRTLFTFCLGVCSLVLLTVTSGPAQDSNMIQPSAGQTSIVKHGERHDPNQAQSSTSPQTATSVRSTSQKGMR